MLLRLLLSLLLTVGGLSASASAAPSPQPTGSVRRLDIPKDAPFLGPAHAKVTLVVWSSFQCADCAQGADMVKRLAQAFPEEVKIVFRHLPQGPEAQLAAEASLAAHEQGRFREMLDLLFAYPHALDRPSLETHAHSLNLDLRRFRAALDSGRFRARIAQDVAAADAAGAQVAPTFFVNGRAQANPFTFDQARTLVGLEIAKADKLLASGTKLKDVYSRLLEEAYLLELLPVAVYKQVDAPADSPSIGPRSARVTIVGWSDFQCPFCAQALPVLKQILKAYPKDVRLVFRHQPLALHSHAQLAAEASMAAHEQGRFWQMHDLLLSNQQALDRPSLERYAQSLGLDLPRFRAALDSGRFRARVEQDAQAGLAAGATGTPTFYFNGREHIGAPSFEQAKVLIAQELQRANQLLAAGTRPDALYQKLLSQPPSPSSSD